MLERDRRRAQTRQYAEHVLRNQRTEQTEKWAACPNHGGSAKQDEDGYWFQHESLIFLPAESGMYLIGHNGFNTLYCFLCNESWHTNTNVTHP